MLDGPWPVGKGENRALGGISCGVEGNPKTEATSCTAGENLECGDLSPLLRGDLSPSNLPWIAPLVKHRALNAPWLADKSASQKSADKSAHSGAPPGLQSAVTCHRFCCFGDLSPKQGARLAARENWTPSSTRRRQVACRKRGQVHALQSGCGFAALGLVRLLAARRLGVRFRSFSKASGFQGTLALEAFALNRTAGRCERREMTRP